MSAPASATGTTPFVCPRCSGTEHIHYGPFSPSALFFRLFPVTAFNELVLGQRATRDSFFCTGCEVPLLERGYVHCPHCSTFQPTSQWTGRRGLGHWFGYLCPDCTGPIPCIWSITSMVLLALTAPLWIVPYFLLRDGWLEERRRRAVEARESGVSAFGLTRKGWVAYGILAWGLPTWIIFTLVTRGLPDLSSGADLVRLATDLPIWAAGGAAWGLAMHAVLGR